MSDQARQSAPRDEAPESAGASRVLGIALWVLVVAALGYGVFKTAATALALFGL